MFQLLLVSDALVFRLQEQGIIGDWFCVRLAGRASGGATYSIRIKEQTRTTSQEGYQTKFTTNYIN